MAVSRNVHPVHRPADEEQGQGGTETGNASLVSGTVMNTPANDTTINAGPRGRDDHRHRRVPEHVGGEDGAHAVESRA
jgi:hypothetical protein